jgi:nucleoside-diphosphate-sugar epimerase
MKTPKKLFCFGYGYTCDYIGHALQERDDWVIHGTTRDAERQAELRQRGVHTHIFEADEAFTHARYMISDITHLLISTPPGDDGDPAFLRYADEIAKLPNLQWLGYLSTTGVYGDRDGRWVDETAEILPTERRGVRRVKAEEQWLSQFHNHNLPVHIFRLAGIYGPGRSALDSVRAGIARRIHKKGHAFGRIHVEDIANVILQSFEHPNPGEIYNVCDDMPAPSHLVIEYACELLGRAPPPIVEFEEANLAPMTRSFYMDNRRVRNEKIKRELKVKLKYPDYKAGLRGCLEAEQYQAAQKKGGSEGIALKKPFIFQT